MNNYNQTKWQILYHKYAKIGGRKKKNKLCKQLLN